MSSQLRHDDVENGLAVIISVIIGVDARVEAQDTLVELGIDSLALVEVAIGVSNRWRISLSAADYDEVRTVGDLVERVMAASAS